MTGTMFGDVWVCNECHWGEADEPAHPISQVEKAAARPQALEEIAQGEGGNGSSGSQHPAEETRTELDDTELVDEPWPEMNPQTGFYP